MIDPMSTNHDIYDPPPSTVSYLSAPYEPLQFTRLDLICLAFLFVIVVGLAIPAFFFDLILGLLVLIGGSLVTLESWYTALGFLSRFPSKGPWGRLGIMAAALIPWIVGLGLSAALMIGLFAWTELAV